MQALLALFALTATAASATSPPTCVHTVGGHVFNLSAFAGVALQGSKAPSGGFNASLCGELPISCVDSLTHIKMPGKVFEYFGNANDYHCWDVLVLPDDAAVAAPLTTAGAAGLTLSFSHKGDAHLSCDVVSTAIDIVCDATAPAAPGAARVTGFQSSCLWKLTVRTSHASVCAAAPVIPAAAQAWVAKLSLKKTEFGTWMDATYCSNITVSGLPTRFAGGSRKLSSSIYNLFARESGSSTSDQAGFPLHRLRDDETWHWYDGDGNIVLFFFDIERGVVTNQTIGIRGKQAAPQFTVPGGVWAGALLAPGATWALTGAATVPAFDPRDSEMAAGNKTLVATLRAQFPEQGALLDRLLSF